MIPCEPPATARALTSRPLSATSRPKILVVKRPRPWPDILHRLSRAGESVAVDVGGVIVGGGAPVVVQSMTNTDTADIDADGRAGRRAAPRRLRNRAHHRRSRRERRGRAEASASGWSGWASTCRWSATSTISATSCLPIIRPAPRRSPNTASIPAMSASRTRRTGSSARSSRWRSATTSRCASASTGARSTRNC